MKNNLLHALVWLLAATGFLAGFVSAKSYGGIFVIILLANGAVFALAWGFRDKLNFAIILVPLLLAAYSTLDVVLRGALGLRLFDIV